MSGQKQHADRYSGGRPSERQGERSDSGATARTPGSALLQQVARLDRLDVGLLERLRHEVLTVPSGWVAEYGQYQSGGWWTLSLLNDSGQPTDVTIKDCDPVETTLLKQMPATREFLSSLGLRYMWVRLARLGPSSFLWEHRDYDELGEAERHRLHVPLVTNSSAALVTGGAKVHLRAGHIWRLTPTHVHGACNMLGPDRFHLILDCYADENLARVSAGEQLDEADAVSLPMPTKAQLEEHFATACSLARLGYDRSAEKYLLRLFYEYTLSEGRVYDLIASVYDSLDRVTEAESWRANKTVLLGLS
ncbi:MAG: aspartyl/asparaginyl beta-hydroxylase domain-containing protein [Dermatophilaceae bacterium]